MEPCAFFLKKCFEALEYTWVDPNMHSTDENDYFGYRVVCNDSYTLVTASQEKDISGTLYNKGAVYLFNNSTGNLLYSIANPDPATLAKWFGSAIGLNTNYFAVGAYSNSDEGRVYIYSIATGLLVHTIINPNPEEVGADEFGKSLAITDDVILITARQERVDTVFGAGRAYIYDTATWTLQTTINNPTGIQNEKFGESCAINGTHYCISSEGVNGEGGVLYIYRRSDNALLHTIANPNAGGGNLYDEFGDICRMNSTYTLVTSYKDQELEGSPFYYASGRVYIYNTVSGQLEHTLINPSIFSTGTSDFFGYGADMSETHIIIGAPGEDSLEATSTGVAYIFKVGTWELVKTIENPNNYGTASDSFGRSCGITSCLAAIGTEYEDSATGLNTGVVYLFK